MFSTRSGRRDACGHPAVADGQASFDFTCDAAGGASAGRDASVHMEVPDGRRPDKLEWRRACDGTGIIQRQRLALPVKHALVGNRGCSYHRQIVAEVDVCCHSGIGSGRSLHQLGEVYPILRGTQQIIALAILLKPLVFRLLRRRVECRRVCGRASDSYDGGRPTREGVSVLGIVGLGRRGMGRRYAIFNRRGVNERVVIIEPGNRVGALSGVECRRIGCRASDGYDCLIPSREGVGVFRRRRLGRRRAAVSGNRAVLDIAGGENGAALIQPRNRVAALGGVEGRRIGCRACYGRNRRTPTSKGICVFSCRRLRRRGVARRCAVSYRRCANERVVVIEPRNRVGT